MPDSMGKPMLEIKNLHVKVEEDGREILRGLDLSIGAGEVHAIMGPNGSGKSTLAYVLSGKSGYEVTDGSVTFDGVDLLALEPDERAIAGVFLAFQYPVEIPGVSGMTFLKTALNAQRKGRGESELSTPDFMRKVREASDSLQMTLTEPLRQIGRDEARDDIVGPAGCLRHDHLNGFDGIAVSEGRAARGHAECHGKAGQGREGATHVVSCFLIAPTLAQRAGTVKLDY